MGFIGQGVALVRTSQRPRQAVRTALHEAWHLTRDEIAAVQATCDQGNAYPPGSYFARPIEQRAQLFEDWSSVIWAGGGVHLGRKEHPEVAVMWKVYSGELGHNVARRQRAPAARLPVLARLTRGLRALAS